MNETTLGTGQNGSRTDTASDVMDSVKQQASQAGDRAKAKIEGARQPAAGRMHAAADAIRDRADRLPGGDTVSGAAQAAADKLDASATYLESHSAREMMDDALAVVKRYPVRSVLIAGALGYLIARALRTRD
jgi:ElaB/YqjD/DUF883 family membrane-anchored ribosome-binding protein